MTPSMLRQEGQGDKNRDPALTVKFQKHRSQGVRGEPRNGLWHGPRPEGAPLGSANSCSPGRGLAPAPPTTLGSTKRRTACSQTSQTANVYEQRPEAHACGVRRGWEQEGNPAGQRNRSGRAAQFARNASTLIPAWRRIARRVPSGMSPGWFGTVV